MSSVTLNSTYDVPSVNSRPLSNLPLVDQLTELYGVSRHIYSYNATVAAPPAPEILYDLYSQIPAINHFQSVYWKFRGTPCVRVTAVGSPAVFGSHVIAFIPIPQPIDPSGYSPILPLTFNPDTTAGYLCQFPHAIVDFSKDTDVDITLFWPSPNDYEPVSGHSDFAVVFGELSGLGSTYGVSPPGVRVDIFCSYPDASFVGLTPQAGKLPVRKVDGDSAPGLVSSGLRFASALMPMIPYLSPFTQIASLGSAVAEKLGYSRLPEEVQQVRGVSSYTVAGSVTDHAYHLGIDPRAMYNMDPVLKPPGVFTNDMHMKVWTYIKSLSGSSVVRVHPMMRPDVAPLRWCSTPLSMVASVYEYYRGGMMIKLIFRSSPLLKYRYVINVHVPDDTPTIVPSLDGSYITNFVDVVGTTELIFEVPYFGGSRWTRTPSWTDLYEAAPFFQIFQLSKGGPADTVPDPFIEMYVKPASDIEFALPTLTMNNRYYQTQSGSVAESTFGTSFPLLELVKSSSPSYTFRYVDEPQAIMPVEPFSPVSAFNTVTSFGGVNVYPPRWSYYTWCRQHAFARTGSILTRVYTSTTLGPPSYDVISAPCTLSLLRNTPGLVVEAQNLCPSGIASYSRGYQPSDGMFHDISIPDLNIVAYKTYSIGDITQPNVLRPTTQCYMHEVPVYQTGLSHREVLISVAGGDDVVFSFFMPMIMTYSI